MFDWLAGVVRWLHHFITEVPIYVAGPAMVVIGALDSSLLSLPEINDYLVVARCHSDPKAVFYFPLFAAAGSVIGCMLLYTIVRRGGQAVMRRRFKATHIARVEAAYARYGVLALAVPALLPPPMPFKIFVATAGVLEYPRWKFMTTIMIARTLRYVVGGALAVFYGERVIEFMRQRGSLIVSVAAGLLIVGVAIYVVAKHIKAPRRSVLEQVAEGTPEGDAAESDTSSPAARD